LEPFALEWVKVKVSRNDTLSIWRKDNEGKNMDEPGAAGGYDAGGGLQ
jgi:hypothetical protein